MKKRIFTLSELFNVFLSTIVHCIVYGTMILIYLLCIIFIIDKNPDLQTSKLLYQIIYGSFCIAPIILAIIGYFCIDYKKVKLSSGRVLKRTIWNRLFTRILAVIGFVTLGIAIDIFTKGKSYNFVIWNVVTELFYYILVAMFPVWYAIIEAIFITIEYSKTSSQCYMDM